MRLRASSELSTCSWLAAICSSLSTPRVGGFGHQAANVVEQRADLAEGRVGGRDDLVGPIGVADGLAGSTVMSLRRFSLAIKPAGSSLPVLIRKPVLNRVSDCSKAALDRPSVLRATNELTFVLIRVIAKHPCLGKSLVANVRPDRWGGVTLRPVVGYVARRRGHPPRELCSPSPNVSDGLRLPRPIARNADDPSCQT